MSELGLVERRRQRNRTEIARTAIVLFADRGFDAVTVDDIASAADISPRTFFRYFATKDEVVLDYERQLQRRLLRAFEARPLKEGAVTALRQAYLETATVERDDRARVVEIGRILHSTPTLRARAHGERHLDGETLEHAVARRLGANGVDVTARTLVAAMAAVAAREFHAWVADGGSGDPAARIGGALALVEQGLMRLERGR